LLLGATLRLTPDDPEKIRARMEDAKSRRMATQPHGSRSAGCFFKNPPDATVGTGKMIDDLGMKGSRRGSAVVSQVHANFIVTEGEGARAEDALALAEEIRERVKREQGIDLEYEVELWRANEPREKPQTDQSAERPDEESANGRESK
jgi:UDP-N-acetylmuramate dehydrogenase